MPVLQALVSYRMAQVCEEEGWTFTKAHLEKLREWGALMSKTYDPPAPLREATWAELSKMAPAEMYRSGFTENQCYLQMKRPSRLWLGSIGTSRCRLRLKSQLRHSDAHGL